MYFFQTVWHGPTLKDVPTFDFEPTGIDGLLAVTESPIARFFIIPPFSKIIDHFPSGENEAYFETIACSLCPAFASFHAPYARKLLGKLVCFTIYFRLIISTKFSCILCFDCH